MKIVALKESTFVNLLRSLHQPRINDENATVVFCSNDRTRIRSNENEWLVLSCKSRKFYRRVIYASNFSSPTPNLVLTNTNLYNLNVSSSSPTMPEINQNVLIHDRPKEFAPKYAARAKIALIESGENVENSKIDLCLKNYFATSKYLHAGDIVCVDLQIHAPEIFYSKPDLQNIYFKICSVDGGEYDNTEINFGYFINSEYTTVHLVSSVECFVPSIRSECSHEDVKVDEISQVLYDVIPGGFRDVNQELEKMILPFLLLESASE